LQDTDVYGRLCETALRCAPNWLVSQVMNEAVSEGLIPPADGIDADGSRLWRLESIARHFGLSDSDISESLEKFEKLHGAIEQMNPATINRIH